MKQIADYQYRAYHNPDVLLLRLLTSIRLNPLFQNSIAGRFDDFGKKWE